MIGRESPSLLPKLMLLGCGWGRYPRREQRGCQRPFVTSQRAVKGSKSKKREGNTNSPAQHDNEPDASLRNTFSISHKSLSRLSSLVKKKSHHLHDHHDHHHNHHCDDHYSQIATVVTASTSPEPERRAVLTGSR